MYTKTIDQSRCDRCTLCVDSCINSRVIEHGEDGYPVFAKTREHQCIYCGHCLAICPRGAITFDLTDPVSEEQYYAGEIEIETNPVTELFALRSEHAFTSEVVKKADLDLILEAMVRAPSSGNEQNRCFYIYDSKEKVDELETAVLDYYTAMFSRFDNPVMLSLAAAGAANIDLEKKYLRNRTIAEVSKKERKAMYRNMMLELRDRVHEGDMRYFYGAPAAFIVTSRKDVAGMHKAFYRSDIAITVTHGLIAAQRIGLASCWMGLAQIAFSSDKRLRANLGIPVHERVDAVFAVGHGSTQWARIPPRGPVKAVWA